MRTEDLKRIVLRTFGSREFYGYSARFVNDSCHRILGFAEAFLYKKVSVVKVG